MRALVTGARGFIGSFLVEQLLQRGYEVTCLLRPKKTGRGWLTGLDFREVAGDINAPASVAEAVADADLVFHVAGLTKAVTRRELYRANVEGTRTVLETTLRFNPGVRRFVLVSSLAAAGPSRTERPLTEADPPQPISHYGRSKLEAERLTLQYARELPVTIIRPPAVYGPRDRDVFSVFKYIKSGWLPTLTGGPRYVSLIHVHDLVRGIVLAAESEAAAGQTYFLANPPSYVWHEVEDQLAEILGAVPRRIPVPVALAFVTALASEVFGRLTRRAMLINLDKFRELVATRWICDSSRAQKEFGFTTEVDLAEGLRSTAAWYAKQGWL